MISELSLWIEVLFLVTCLMTIGFFHYSNGKPWRLTGVILLWSVGQSILAYLGFYQVIDSMPPRFALVLIPSLLFLIYGLLPKQQIWVIQNRNTEISTFSHSIRIPVEIVLYALFLEQMVPELMTFEGRNFDILIGISSLAVAWLHQKSMLSKKLLILWNLVGLFFVLFILINGVLSAELPFQQFAFEQPNRAINYFPFVLLPATIVPIVIWIHLSDILKLRTELKSNRDQ